MKVRNSFKGQYRTLILKEVVCVGFFSLWHRNSGSVVPQR